MLREIGLRRALHQGWKWAFKSGLSVELSEPLSVNEVFLMLLVFFVLWFICFKTVFITSHKLDGIYGVRQGGVWIIDLEKAIKGRFYGCGVDKSFWCFLLFNSLKNSMQKFRNHPYTGCCRNSATTDSLGVAEILQALIHRVSQKFCEHSYTEYHRNTMTIHTLNVAEILHPLVH